jgi:hypothetical protein
MGIALIVWQQVEDAHYSFFVKLCSRLPPEICSIIYFSPPTFESRRVMVDRIAQIAINSKGEAAEWKKLNKKLEIGASQRGKIAHFGLEFEIKITGQGPKDFDRGEARLARSKHNKIKRNEDEQHLTRAEIGAFVGNFDDLIKNLADFTSRLKSHLQREAALELGLSTDQGSESTAHLSLPKPATSG